MLLSALANLVTKPVATISGLVFTAAFLACSSSPSAINDDAAAAANTRASRAIQSANGRRGHQRASLGLTKPYRKLVAIRSPHNLFMLEKALAETDPDTTDVVVMTAKVDAAGAAIGRGDARLRHLRSAADDRRRRAGRDAPARRSSR